MDSQASTPEGTASTTLEDDAGPVRAPANVSTRLEGALERSVGIDSMPRADDREQQIIVRSLAVGFSAFRWVCLAVALVLLASGLLFASLLLMVAADLPRLMATRYARRRGVDLHWQSGLARNAARPSALVAALAYVAVAGGIIAFDGAVGHPLIPWSWSFEFQSFDVFLIIPFIGCAIGAFIGWRVRRRRYLASLE